MLKKKDKSNNSVVTIFRNSKNNIYRFTVENHTDSIVCAGLSILTLNTINSIEKFTDEVFTVDLNEDLGFIDFSMISIKDKDINKDVNLLLNSFLLGVKGIESEYKEFLNVIDGGAK